MENLQNLTNLEELWLGRNRIKAVNLCGLKCLKKISLQSNRLTSMTGFEVWYLNMTNICCCTYKINILLYSITAVHSQQLNFVFVPTFQDCVALEELYLSHNGISKIEGISTLVNLRILDVSSNKLTSVSDIQNLTWYHKFPSSILYNMLIFSRVIIWSLHWIYVCSLEDLWLNDNQIESLESIAEDVAGSREKLTTIYLENNPCVSFYTE